MHVDQEGAAAEVVAAEAAEGDVVVGVVEVADVEGRRGFGSHGCTCNGVIAMDGNISYGRSFYGWDIYSIH